MGRLFLVTILTGCVGCGGTAPSGSRPGAPSGNYRSNLASVGLEVISEGAAGIPQQARGQWIPVLVRRGGPLPPHRGGYLIVSVDGGSDGGAAAMANRLGRWARGERLVVRVRRNPSVSPGATWWESDVALVRPDR